MWKFKKWIVERIHVELGIADQNLDTNNRTQESDILDFAIHNVGFLLFGYKTETLRADRNLNLVAFPSVFYIFRLIELHAIHTEEAPGGINHFHFSGI